MKQQAARRGVISLLAVLLLLGAACHSPHAVEEGAGFPASWTGVWKGTCRALRPDGRTDRFAMELHILPAPDPERMTWKLVYGEGERRQERAYEIYAEDAGAGHYVIDEKNSILIDSYLVEDTLCSQFLVEGSLITTFYRKEGARIRFKLASAGYKDARQTGGKEDIPWVEVYPVQVLQWAELARAGPSG